jgi:hypothetical protein
VMKKLALFVGLGTGFVVGSWAGRAPFERLEGAVRNVMGQPKVEATLQSAAESAESVRDATLDAATGALSDAAGTATEAIDGASKKISHRSQRVEST